MAWEIIALGLGPSNPTQPSSSQGLSHRRGLTFPTSWATTAEKPPCLAPQRLPNSCPVCVCVRACHIRVCARLCACENRVWLSAWVPCVCLTVQWSPGAVLDGWKVVVEACIGCMHGCVPGKGPCPAGGSCCFLSLFPPPPSLTQLKQGFLVNLFIFGRPQGLPGRQYPFGLLRELWGPLKSGHNSPWREAKTPEGPLAPLL